MTTTDELIVEAREWSRDKSSGWLINELADEIERLKSLLDEKRQTDELQNLAMVLATDVDSRADMIAAVRTYRSADRAEELGAALLKIVSPSPAPHKQPARQS